MTLPRDGTGVTEHNRYQRQYYETRFKPNMQPSGSPYVVRQVARAVREGGLTTDRPLLEVGAGLGRHTLPLLERGFTVTALDLSPVMLQRLAGRAAGKPLTTVACDLARASEALEERFSQAAGFFTLHHMHDLELIFRGLAGVLEPGAPVVFCEPNAYNPLFYFQMLVTPGMTWRGDGGTIRMRRGPVLGAMRRAGFTQLSLARFGLFPPQLTNRPAGARLEDRLQRLPLPAPIMAFTLFCGVWPGSRQAVR
ncbi:MAG: class I SAM-dependent methyltransferase [Acidobacteria bacterium]|nr:class I SAM-dependent methyltransferase [Acidobacteriota bacterium]